MQVASQRGITKLDVSKNAIKVRRAAGRTAWASARLGFKPPLGAVGTSSCRLRHLQAISSTLLGSLGSLVVFNISDNALEALPSQIGLLRCAMVHKVQMSRAASIASSIRSHEQRRSHAQQPCPVAINFGLPTASGQPPPAACSQLRVLDASGNQLASLPAGLWQLGNLEELKLADNVLTTIPPAISGLAKLKVPYESHGGGWAGRRTARACL